VWVTDVTLQTLLPKHQTFPSKHQIWC